MPPDVAKSRPRGVDRQKAERNRLLRRLPEDEYESLRPLLDPVSLTPRQTLYAPWEPIASVYFPESATLAIIAEMRHGEHIEVDAVGNEGFIGAPALLGAMSMPYRAIVQIPGDSMRLSTDALRTALRQLPELRRVLLRYPLFLVQRVAQMVACNRLHTLMQRCARWLLVAHDRVQTDTFPLTQGFLAELLAVRRPGVSVTAEMLQDAGLIRYTRGKITILNREALEQISCECYQTMRDAYTRLFPDHRARAPQDIGESALHD